MDQAEAMASAMLPDGDPRRRVAIELAADAHRAAGELAEAEALYRRWIALIESAGAAAPRERFDAPWGLGEILLAAGRYAEADRTFAAAEIAYPSTGIDEKNHLAEVLVGRARAQLELGRVDAARGFFVRAAELDPYYRFDRAVLEPLPGRPEDAQAALAGADASLQQAIAERVSELRTDEAAGPIADDRLAELYTSRALLAARSALRGVAPGALGRASGALAAAMAHSAAVLKEAGAGFDDNEIVIGERLALVAEQADLAIAVAAAHPRQPGVTRLALDAVLRRKGRLLDIMSSRRRSLRGALDAESRADLQYLDALYARLAAALIGDRSRELVLTLQRGVTRLERVLFRRAGRLSPPVTAVDNKAVQAAIPQGAALVEMVRYRPFDALARSPSRQFGAPRYGAIVLGHDGEPVFIPLGEAAAIDAEVAQARRSFWSSTGAEAAATAARRLGRLLFDPLRAALRSARHLLLSPAASLDLVPFAALRDANDRPLVETFLITYLTSGRELVRESTSGRTRMRPVIVADPDYRSGDSAGGEDRTIDLAKLRWPRLPGTRVEGEVIHGLLPDSALLVGSEATKKALGALAGPRVLHVAAHGYFAGDTASGGGGSRGAIPRPDTGAPPQQAQSASDELLRRINPLLLSGLVLARPPVASAAPSDSLLTALEVSGLDLEGTALVVLSACQTGLGVVEEREGVFGLRRALSMAGAQSQVLSLWQVSDEATRDLMVAFYRGLSGGAGRSEALRQAQLQLLSDGRHAHPYYWASFIASGAWTPLPDATAH